MDGVLALMKDLRPWIILASLGIAGAAEIVQHGTGVIQRAVAEGRDINQAEWDEINARTRTRLRRINSDTE
jgi:hypothetical protein